MVQSKPWNWDKAREEIWDRPSEDSYYYLHRWADKGFKKMLNLGCGKGRHSLLFAGHHFDVSAYDLSEKAVELVRSESARSASFTNPAYKRIDQNTVLKSEGPEENMPHFYVTPEELRELLTAFAIIHIRQVQELFLDNRGGWHFHVHASIK